MTMHQENSTSIEHIEKLEIDRNSRLTEARKREAHQVILTFQQVRLELIKHSVTLGTLGYLRNDKESKARHENRTRD